MNPLDLAIAHKFNRDNAIETFSEMSDEEIVSSIKLHINSGVGVYQMYSAYFNAKNCDNFYFKDAIEDVNKILDEHNIKTSYKL